MTNWLLVCWRLLDICRLTKQIVCALPNLVILLKIKLKQERTYICFSNLPSGSLSDESSFTTFGKIVDALRKAFLGSDTCFRVATQIARERSKNQCPMQTYGFPSMELIAMRKQELPSRKSSNCSCVVQFDCGAVNPPSRGCCCSLYM